jgi:hypothetical protein
LGRWPLQLFSVVTLPYFAYSSRPDVMFCSHLSSVNTQYERCRYIDGAATIDCPCWLAYLPFPTTLYLETLFCVEELARSCCLPQLTNVSRGRMGNSRSADIHNFPWRIQGVLISIIAYGGIQGVLLSIISHGESKEY